MYIPTKNDLISPDTKIQAINQLIEYLYSLFPSHEFRQQEKEESFQDFIMELYEGKIDLVPFFDEFDEIRGHEKDFKRFCLSQFKKMSQFLAPSWGDDETDAMQIIADRKQQQEYNQKSAIEDRFYDDSEVNLLGELMRQIGNGPEREESRFKVAYLSIQNTLAIDAKKSPSDMPVEARIPMQKRAKGAKMSYSAKKQALEDILYPSGFWQKFGEVFEKDITHKEHRKQNAKYKDLLKKAKFSNTKRDKEKMASIVDKILPNESVELREELKKDIKNFMVRKELSPLPQEDQSDKDKILSGFRNCACKEFLEIISLLVQERLLGIKLQDNSKLKEYLSHRISCSKCREYENSLEQRMSYRVERMKLIENLPFYPYHSYRAEGVQKTQERDLVRYYEREFEHNPCDMYLYYLLLAYKNAGLIEKATDLYHQVKELPEYKRLQYTQLATELQGA